MITEAYRCFAAGIKEKADHSREILPFPKSYVHATGLFVDIKDQALGPHCPLSPAEAWFVKTLKQASRQKPMRVLGLGETFGLSFLRIAKALQTRSDLPQTEFTATNLHPGATIGNMITEAERRLAIVDHDSWNAFVNTLPSRKCHNLYKTVEHLRPLLSPQQLEYVRENHELIKYVPGIDSNSLESQFESKFGIIHESFGGFWHADDKLSAFKQALGILNRPGLIVTSTPHGRFGFERDGFDLSANGIGCHYMRKGHGDHYTIFECL